MPELHLTFTVSNAHHPPFFKFTCNGNYPKHTPCQWNGRPGTEAKALKFVQNTSYFYQDLKECKALR